MEARARVGDLVGVLAYLSRKKFNICILKHILKLDTNEPAGINIYCDKHYVSIGSMSFSLTCTDFKTVTISEVYEKYISITLELK